MKRTFLILAFAIVSSITYAQQNPPNVKPLDSIVVVNPDLNKITYTTVDQEPMFPGGFGKLFDYFQKNLRYPDKALRDKIEGKVFLTFVVDRDGSLVDIKLLRGLTSETNVEALRLMKECPKWIPGMQNGKPVRVQYNIPVTFKLK
ncbi:MAG: energy transducer TonB [Sphingobacteriales bacterium]